jgi:hypothetical protein
MEWEYREEELSTAFAAIDDGEPGRHPGGAWVWGQEIVYSEPPSLDDPIGHSLGQVLTSLGADGWELVAFTPAVPDARVDSELLRTVAIFKRPVGPLSE